MKIETTLMNVFSATDFKPLSKFKIPKKKRLDSESNSNALHIKDEPGSDSEPELRIAESETETEETSQFGGRRGSSTTDDDNDSTTTTTKPEEEPSSKPNNDDGDEECQKLIKEKLNQMVGSLGPEEARKLLLRVGSNQSKLTLEQLKSMLNSDNEEVQDQNVSVKEEITDEGNLA